ncbi:MAG: hypothetical protein JNK19_00895 [Tabrizicola sp.]|nr:hypothetical protein [Tabrizicola sp.]
MTYTHNGSSGTTDYFETVDMDGDTIGFTVTITPPTSAITVNPATLPTLTAGSAFSQTLTSSGGTATYTYALQSGALPPGLSLSSGGILSGTPTQRGSYGFSVRVTDSHSPPRTYDKGYAGTVQPATLTMSPNLIIIPRNQTVSRTLTTSGGVAPLSYMVETFPSNMPAGLTLSSGGVISGSTSAAAGDIVMSIRVTDSSTGPGQWFELEPLTIRLVDNLSPTANAGTDQTVASGASVTLNGTASSDPENASLTYAWTQTGGTGVILSSDTAASPTFTAPTVAFNAAPQVLTFSLTVSDGVNTSTADTVQVTVNPAANLSPTANAGTDQTVASGASVTLSGSGSDPENQALTYAWTQTGGTGVTLSSTTAASPTFTAPTVAFNAAPQVLTFSLTVSDGVNTSTADTVQVTVNPAANLSPTANAGTDQTVASGASVTLSGSGSDPENQALTYAWTQTGGTGVLLSSTTAASPTFTAPTLTYNAPDAVLTFDLVVNDGVQDSVADSVTVTVTAPVDVSRPSVTLAGMPASVLPGNSVTISASFSETVTGLALGDFTVTGGSATGLSGSGSAYSVTLLADGSGPLTITLPANMAFDVASNGNLASNTLSATSAVGGETEEEIAQYLARRANALAGAQPDLIRLLNPGGNAQVSVSSKGFSFATNGTQSVWASLTGRWGETGTTDTRYVLGAVGAHAWLSDRTILGLMLEFDQMVQRESGRRIEGTGWLIGPYVAGQIQDQPLYYEGRLLWGQSRNEVLLFGPGTAGRFDSTRLLAQFKLQGEFALGEAIASPFVDASYVSDRQDAYTDGLGTPIAAQEVRQSQIALGIDLRQAFVVNGGVLTPSAGVSAVYSNTSGSGTTGLVDPEHDGWRGRIRAGLIYTRGLSRFEAQAFLDGIGTEDYRNYGLSLGFETQF